MKKLTDFSKVFKVTAPTTNNILAWWKCVLVKLKETDIQFVYLIFKAAMQFELAEYFLPMLDMLEGRRVELELI